MKRFVFCALFVLVAASASAQVNPIEISWDSDPTEFTTLTGYSVGYFSSATATAPVQEAAIAKPAGTCSPCAWVPLPSRPTTFANWWVGVRAIAGTVSSPWSVLVPFVRVPIAPTGLKVR